MARSAIQSEIDKRAALWLAIAAMCRRMGCRSDHNDCLGLRVIPTIGIGLQLPRIRSLRFQV
jgi:hypothetical protein